MKFIFTLTLALLLSSTSLASVNTVTNLLNSGPGSLRNTIANATSGDTIRFNPNLISAGNATIVLTSEIAFNKNLTIIGLYNATDTLFISGNNTNRIFHVDLSSSTIKTLVLDSVALINGKTSGDGGAIRFINGSALNIVNSFISKNQASKGAGVYSLSTISTIIKLEHSTINGNYGDGIYSTSATSSVTSTVQVRFSTISGNTGSGVYANTILESIVYLTNSRVSENNRNGVYSLSSTSRIIINNSMAIGNKQYGAFSYSYVSSPSTSSGRSGIKLINSTISGNTEAGIYSFSSSLFGYSLHYLFGNKCHY